MQLFSLSIKPLERARRSVRVLRFQRPPRSFHSKLSSEQVRDSIVVHRLLRVKRVRSATPPSSTFLPIRKKQVADWARKPPSQKRGQCIPIGCVVPLPVPQEGLRTPRSLTLRRTSYRKAGRSAPRRTTGGEALDTQAFMTNAPVFCLRILCIAIQKKKTLLRT